MIIVMLESGQLQTPDLKSQENNLFSTLISMRTSVLLISSIIGLTCPVLASAGLVSLGGTTPQSTVSSAYASQCVATFPHAFYEGQAFKAYDTQVPDTLGSSWEILSNTNVHVYNPFNALGDSLTANSLQGKVPTFSYVSNGRPGTTHFNY